MKSIQMIKGVINNNSLKPLLTNTFGEVDNYKINYTLSENGEIKYINLEVHVSDDISNNINMVKLSNNLILIYRHCLSTNLMDFEGPFKMKITCDCEYNDNYVELESLSGSYDDDDWCDFDESEYLGTVTITSGHQTFSIDMSRYYGEFTLEIDVLESDPPIQTNFNVDVNLEYNSEDEVNMTVEYNKKRVSLLDKDTKLQLSNLIKELNKVIDADLEEVKIDAEEKSYANLMTDLKKLTNKNFTDKLFEDMNKDAIVTDFDITVYIGEDRDCRVRYFTEGYGFNWNCLNWGSIPSDEINIDVESQMLDRVDRNFWSKSFKNEIAYHSNDIVCGKVNDYVEMLRGKFSEVLKSPENKNNLEDFSFSLTLNKGSIHKMKEVDQYVYGIGFSGEVIFVSRDKNFYDLDKLKNLLNEIITDLYI